MVGIPVLEVECTYLNFVRVSSQVVGHTVWDDSGQGISEGLLRLHERLVLDGDAEIISSWCLDREIGWSFVYKLKSSDASTLPCGRHFLVPSAINLRKIVSTSTLVPFFIISMVLTGLITLVWNVSGRFETNLAFICLPMPSASSTLISSEAIFPVTMLKQSPQSLRGWECCHRER